MKNYNLVSEYLKTINLIITTVKKITVISSIGILIVLVGVFLITNSGTTPEQKVEKLERKIEQKEEASGYNACVEKIEENQIKHDKCIVDKIIISGYNDNIDCIGDFQNPICDTPRYNAEVDASNECRQIYDEINIDIFDCMILLEEF